MERKIKINKITDPSLMREACEMTFMGTSKQSLLDIYKSEHSPARTQWFWVQAYSIPLFVSTHLIRHHVGSQPFQLTCRDDRAGGNPGLIAKVDALNEQLREAMDIATTNGSITLEDLQNLIDGVVAQTEWLKNNTDRFTPVNLGLMLNAQSLIDMAKLRLCSTASKETQDIFRAVKQIMNEADPALADMMVRKCVYRNGLCGEQRCCGFNHTPAFSNELGEYLENFTEKQRGK